MNTPILRVASQQRGHIRLAMRSALAFSALFCALACDGAMPGPGPDLGSGGALDAGSGGVSASGGASSGGSFASGGQGSGGAPGTGGIATGGNAAGGASGGAPSGGAPNTGGDVGSGGDASGGSGSGGAPGFSPCLPAGSPCVILPLGDSITEGFASSGGGYRVELFRQALQNDKSITFVGSASPNGPNDVDGTPFPKAHQGHGGYTIDTDAGHNGISGMITNNALDNFDPDIVLLMIGTNDINGNVDVGNAPNRLANLVDDITERAPDTLVVVASCVPVKDDGTDAKIVTYNTGVQQKVQERAAAGDHVIFLDNYATIHDEPNWENSLMADNLHPSYRCCCGLLGASNATLRPFRKA